MKIPRELADFYEDYIEKNPQLGYRKISQIILHILQNKVRELMKEQNLGIKRSTHITLKSGTYTKEDLENMIKDMET